MEVKSKVKPLSILIIIFLVLIVLLGVSVGYVLYLGTPVNKSSKKSIEIEILPGTNSSSIGTILKDKDLIRSEFYFKLYLKLNNINDLKATTYNLNKSMSTKEIISILQKGNSSGW